MIHDRPSRRRLQRLRCFQPAKWRKGWSQQQLADSANVPKITIQRIELAKSSATIDMAISIAHALEIDLKELMIF